MPTRPDFSLPTPDPIPLDYVQALIEAHGGINAAATAADNTRRAMARWYKGAKPMPFSVADKLRVSLPDADG